MQVIRSRFKLKKKTPEITKNILTSKSIVRIVVNTVLIPMPPNELFPCKSFNYIFSVIVLNKNALHSLEMRFY